MAPIFLIQLVGGVRNLLVGEFAVSLILFQPLKSSLRPRLVGGVQHVFKRRFFPLVFVPSRIKIFQQPHTYLSDRLISLATCSMAELTFFQPLAFFKFQTRSATFRFSQ